MTSDLKLPREVDRMKEYVKLYKELQMYAGNVYTPQQLWSQQKNNVSSQFLCSPGKKYISHFLTRCE